MPAVCWNGWLGCWQADMSGTTFLAHVRYATTGSGSMRAPSPDTDCVVRT